MYYFGKLDVPAYQSPFRLRLTPLISFNGQLTIFNRFNYPSHFIFSSYSPFFHHLNPVSILCSSLNYTIFQRRKRKIANLTYSTTWKFSRSNIFNGQVTIFSQSNYLGYFVCSRLSSSKSSQYPLQTPAFDFSSFRSCKFSLFSAWIIPSFHVEKWR